MEYTQFLTYLRENHKKPPIKLSKIAVYLGLDIYGSREFGKNISGKIYIKNGKYRIVVNLEKEKVRQRFTVAHEIAHFILHKEQIGDGLIEDELYRSELSNEQEKEANELAADIIMPMPILMTEARKYNFDISELARLFQVSEIAMAIRLGYVS